MKKNKLIGESGGSKTDWAFKSDGNLLFQFSTYSLHPKNWSKDLFNELFDLFEKKSIDFQETELSFFGAGCHNQEKSEELVSFFRPFGFQAVHVSGDVTAACQVTLGNADGYAAILGSGSVFVEYKATNIVNLFGGLGRELGDEGGGFHFGKIVLNSFCMKTLEPVQVSILKSYLSVREIAQLKRNEVSEELCLVLAARLGDNLFEFQNYHLANIDLFYSKYVQPNIQKDATIHFVGSYAFFHQEIIKSYFQAKGYSVGKIIARPIDRLIEII